MRILVGSDFVADANSGAAGTVLATNEALGSLGHAVVPFWADAIPHRIKHGNLHYLLELPRAYRTIVRDRLAREQFDVVQLSQPHAHLAGRFVMGCKRPRPLMLWRSHGLEAKVDAAIDLYGEVDRRGPRSMLRMLTRIGLLRAQRNAVKWSDGIIVPCEDDRAYLTEEFRADPRRVRVIWHGVPDEYLSAEPPFMESRLKRVLHVSQMSVNKGPVVMHRVAQALLSQRNDVEMTWVCPKELHSRIRLQLSSVDQGRLNLVEWTDRGTLMSLYDSHGIFLFPTLAEGAAKAVMEAMSRGLAVVASDTSGPRDYIVDGVNGRVVPVGDWEAMSSSCAELLSNPRECERMGHAARQTASRFTWQRCAVEMVSFYEELMTLRQPGSIGCPGESVPSSRGRTGSM